MKRLLGIILVGSVLTATHTLASSADVVTASADHYTLRQETTSKLTPNQVWQKLIKPESWWHPDHTYSGKSENLSLSAEAGGLWREDWDGGSVFHGSVLLANPGKQLRLNAPFGPLQELGVNVVWTITISEHEDGSKITFDEIANGTEASKLDALAPAVDFVKTEAINRLAAN
ncbi:SRPBCC domain-containing protein [Kordiimonas sp. SCSIO 12610]|uniref:SRPBCC family protein n=1 Tax=Kordiimonas sp. SCSIO 12610 TaxID=2829597 RepID=UPI00210AFC30|nr:hypothetical protein [Kordiimonas sp. SCSIO 12610]UTW53998.1 hypothetical protein KFF44_09100 [Kordiimonas sp. SCSIO 12610]